MKRYLLNFSYIGSNFRGVQREIPKDGISSTDPNSIQGMLEIGLKSLKPINDPEVYLSSRTDHGVHALRTSAHVDLERFDQGTYDPSFLIRGLNKTFEKAKSDLRIQSVQVVPQSFHARFSAKSRTYLYRLAVRKHAAVLDSPAKSRFSSSSYKYALPMSEWHRCYFINNPEFDVAKVQEASKLFLGTKDFRSFMARPKQHPPDKNTTRTITELSFNPGRPLMSATYDPLSDQFNYWQVVCTGQSFLYRQVRRIVGLLVAVAQSRLHLKDVHSMLEVPHHLSWNPIAVTVPAYGLFLCDVKYNPEDLILPPESSVNSIMEISREKKPKTLQERLEERRAKLKAVQTRLTLSNGDVYLESRGVEGSTNLERVLGQRSAGFVVDEKPDLQVGDVLPGLFVGSQDVACDFDLLSRLEVTHVLSIGVEVTVPASLRINQLKVELLDLPESKITAILDKCCTFINQALSSDSPGKVFVHCNAGISRAPTVVCAYLIKHKGYSMSDALSHVKNCRPSIKPNEGFLKQLQMLSENK